MTPHTTTPDLDLELSFEPIANGFTLNAAVTNATDAPSLYTSVMLMLDRRLKVNQSVRNYTVENRTLCGVSEDWAVRAYSMQFNVPQYMPIVIGVPAVFMSERAMIRPDQRYAVAYRLSCPGFDRQQLGLIIREAGDPRFEILTDQFELRRPDSPIAGLLRGLTRVRPTGERVPSGG